MAKQQSNEQLEETTQLSPSPRLALLVVIFGLSLLPLPIYPWPTLLISIFGVFLLLQTYTLRIEFTQNALIVYQLGKEIRRFPFKEWLAWRILLPGLPGILYFREKASPHLLPILFDPITLASQLRLRVGTLEKPKVNNETST